ncbi:CaiB/BaiF CoA transferase family protein [Neoroseomonas soli]|uniref:CoA transferase n=1 Tax=Neoroseomonas soli TaxID=1081025 RepID=A0A9X9X0L5_9PROT|nr:CoA transferase [Neoroseomonas soli]MBR0672944.1 CoA transferase [Neoroseomonas soli]
MIPLLSGLRVLDLTSVIYGPLIGQVLGDFGADVIKVESPEGDLARGIQPRGPQGDSAMFVCNNRNKRSIVLDLKTAGGREVFTRLLRWAEVFVHNMRPAAIDRLGFGFAPVAAINPEIIYCAAVGFGSGGRYAGRPAFDDVIQAAGGIAALPSYRGQDPAYVPGVMADKVAALTATYGVMAAIAARGRGMKGPIEVEAAMFEAVAAFVLNEHLAAAAFGGPPESAGYHRMFAADRRPYRTLDGWIAALPYTEQQWRRLLEFTGREDVLEAPWFSDPGERSAHIAELYTVLAEEMARRSTDDWLRALQELDIPHARVNRLEDLLRDPHLQDVDFFAPNGSGLARSARQPVRFPSLPDQPDRPAPALGADGQDVLAMLGYDAAGVAALRGAAAFG